MHKILPVPLALLLLTIGCGRTPMREIHPVALPPQPAEDEVSRKRAEQLKQVISPLKIRGVVMFPSAFFDRETAPDSVMMEALKRCGFNRVYCHITSEQELNGRLREFITSAKSAGLSVEIAFSQLDYYRRYRGNQLIRWALIQYPGLVDVARKVADFSRKLPENVRPDGVMVHIAPDIYNGKNAVRMYDHLYCWTEKRYGKGGDNDLLMREAYEQLQAIAAIPELPPMTIAFADFFHEKAKEGELSVGTIGDFAKISPRLAVLNTANLPSRMSRNIADELADAPQGCRIIAVVPLAHHTSVDADRLRRRDWNDFIRAVNALVDISKRDDNFHGVILSPFAVVEYLRLEK